MSDCVDHERGGGEGEGSKGWPHFVRIAAIKKEIHIKRTGKGGTDPLPGMDGGGTRLENAGENAAEVRSQLGSGGGRGLGGRTIKEVITGPWGVLGHQGGTQSSQKV